ncbi:MULTISPECIES: biotin transporter BioY [Arthrobacter]|uniref:Biotin transporter n=2 Tax=Arthrobacter TaxID=1663 RepID=A0ABU9KIR0_9MICC|nr:biotin transporter BioY [Arthrobacter sp. YJM1]MDP5225809.1 biotin transporter BioY [Arthrobacter sp. YJM1]
MTSPKEETMTADTPTAGAGRSAWTPRDTALVAVFAALVAASAFVPGISIGGVGVPITIQTLVIALTGLVLGGRRAFAAVLLYVVLGLAGLPIFSQGRAGLGVMAGPSAGYIVAFPLVAGLTGFFASHVLRRGLKPRTLWFFLAALVSSLVLTHTLGPVGIMLNAKVTLAQGFIADLPFYPGDILKDVLAAVLATALHRAFPDILLRRVARRAQPETGADA